jgi:hypothetical protein
MKTFISLMIVLIASTFNSSYAQIVRYPCPANGSAESNNFSNWSTLMGTATEPQNMNNFVAGFDANRFGVHGSTANYPNPLNPMIINGVDKYGGFAIPSEGNYCFTVGNNITGGQADLMKYTFTVTEANKKFKFRYALVLQDGGHASGNPSAWFYMLKGNTHLPNAASSSLFTSTMRQFIADLNDPYYKQSTFQNDVIYRSWECIEYDLSAYVGQQVSFIAMVRDCVQGAHFGYMYIDGLCTAWPATAAMSLNGTTFCKEQQIILNAANSQGEDRYYVEVGEAIPYGGYVPGGQIVSEWFVAQQAPNGFNLSAFMASKGLQLKCGQEYNVTLAVSNNCAPYNSVNQRFTIVCPSVNAGPDKQLCCGAPTNSFQIGPNALQGNTYQWTSFPAGFTSNLAKPTVNPTTNTAYFVNMTQPNGCIGRDTVLVRFLPTDYTLNLTQSYKLCDYAPYIKASLLYNDCPASNPEFFNQFGVPDYSFIQWYFKPEGSNTYQFLGTGQTIHAPNQDGLIEARLQTACTGPIVETASITIKYRPGGSGMIVDNTVSPLNGSGPESSLNAPGRIFEFGPFAPETIGEGPAYGIQDFKLNIFNRWGTLIRVITKADAGRGPNDNVMQGDIFWDGTWQGYNGVPERVQDGVYVYTLDLLYCGATQYVNIHVPYAVDNYCIDQNFWGNCTEYLPGWVGQMTVLN